MRSEDEYLTERVGRFFTRAGVAFATRKMMGGICFLVDGKMCVGARRGRLMARIGPEAYDAALTRKGCGPMDFTGRPMRGFVWVAEEALETEAELRYWLGLALEFNPKAKKSAK